MKIERVESGNLDELLPLVAAYQRFYGVTEIDQEKNRSFFARFAGDNEFGAVHLYRKDGAAVGFVTLYFSFSSVRAERLAILNDLYVVPEQRGLGLGRELIDFACEHARERGIAWLEWATAEDNERAQRLYDATDAERSAWLHYFVAIGASSPTS